VFAHPADEQRYSPRFVRLQAHRNQGNARQQLPGVCTSWFPLPFFKYFFYT
jgi:hypothetical protein